MNHEQLCLKSKFRLRDFRPSSRRVSSTDPILSGCSNRSPRRLMIDSESRRHCCMRFLLDMIGNWLAQRICLACHCQDF